MKARVNTYLNIRTGTPAMLPDNNPGDKYYSPGDTIDIVEIVSGQEYKANKTWYKLDTGVFVWSGGVDNNPTIGSSALTYTNAEIAKLAVEQNLQYLKIKFPNILSISDSVQDLDNAESHVIVLYLKDNNTDGLPEKLEIKMPDGIIRTINTEIVTGVGDGNIHLNQKDDVRKNDSHGSVCCIIETDMGLKKVVTAGHVFSEGSSKNFNGKLPLLLQSPALINDLPIGNWFFQVINFKTDFALISIDNFQIDSNCVSFKNKNHYELKKEDVKKTKVKLISKVSGDREGFILDFNSAWDVEYSNEILQKNKIILIGSTNDRNTSSTVSQRGDSGGCVYEPVSGNIVGLILGGNDKFTWVLSLKEIFTNNNFKLV